MWPILLLTGHRPLHAGFGDPVGALLFPTFIIADGAQKVLTVAAGLDLADAGDGKKRVHGLGRFFRHVEKC